MKIRQQRTIEKNICKKMILLSFCMILMVSMAGCGNKRKENLIETNQRKVYKLEEDIYMNWII